MNDHPEIWSPLTGMPDGAEQWGYPSYRELEQQWLEMRATIKPGGPVARFIDALQAERDRAFAIQTGQIEGLYRFKPHVAEHLIAEGFADVVGAHTFESLDDRTIKGLLEDQYAACEMVWRDVAAGRPVEAEAAWLHHRFVRTHPFQDGNGRVSRLLMAHAYAKRGMPPPIVNALDKLGYIVALQNADRGDLGSLAGLIGASAQSQLLGAIQIAELALSGRLNRPTGNGGRRVGDEYLPPCNGELDLNDLARRYSSAAR